MNPKVWRGIQISERREILRQQTTRTLLKVCLVIPDTCSDKNWYIIDSKLLGIELRKLRNLSITKVFSLMLRPALSEAKLMVIA